MKRFKFKSRFSKIMLFSALILGVAGGARAIPDIHALMSKNSGGLSVFKGAKQNNLRITESTDAEKYQGRPFGPLPTKSTNGKERGSFILPGSGYKPNQRETQYLTNTYRDQGNQDEGSPMHIGARIPDQGQPAVHRLDWDYYDIGRYHSGLAIHQLQRGGTVKPHNFDMKADFGVHNPDNNTRSSAMRTPKSNGPVRVIYNHAAQMALPQSEFSTKTTGNSQKGSSTTTSGKGFTKPKPVDVMITISHIQWYAPWRGDYSIQFSKNLAKGLRYNGVTSMDVDYKFFYHGKQVSPIDGSYMKFLDVDGTSSYGEHKPSPLDDTENNMLHVRHEGALRGNSHLQNPGATLGKDKTGEHMNPVNSNTEYAMKPFGEAHNMGTEHNYYSHLYHQRVVGGAHGNNYADRSESAYGVVIPLKGSDEDIKAGSGIGYGQFKPYTNIKVNSSKKQTHHHWNPQTRTIRHGNPTAKVYPVYKGIINRKTGELVAGQEYNNGSVTKSQKHNVATVRRPGSDEYSYVLTGRFSKRSNQNAFYVHQSRQKITTHDSKSGSHTIYTPWKTDFQRGNNGNYDKWTNDTYDLMDNFKKTAPNKDGNGNPYNANGMDDNVSGQVPDFWKNQYSWLTNVKSNGAPTPQYNNSGIKLHLNNNQMTQENNKAFKYQLDVNAGDQSSNDTDGHTMLLPNVTKHGASQCKNSVPWHIRHDQCDHCF